MNEVARLLTEAQPATERAWLAPECGFSLSSSNAGCASRCCTSCSSGSRCSPFTPTCIAVAAESRSRRQIALTLDELRQMDIVLRVAVASPADAR